MSEEMASERFYSVSQRLQSDEAKQDIYLKVNKPLTLRVDFSI